MGQQIVGDLASCATTALKATIPALIASISPVSGAMSQGKDIVGSFTGKGNSEANGNVDRNASTKRQGPTNDAKMNPPAATDAAGTALTKDMTYIEMLNSYINGPGGNINWEKAAGDGSDAKKTIGFIAAMLSDAKPSLSSIPRDSPSFAKVSTILDTTSRVIITITSH